jgi:hypothetical protein
MRHVIQCKARNCFKRATLVAEKFDSLGRHIRRIELCEPYCDVVVERERKRGPERSATVSIPETKPLALFDPTIRSFPLGF